MTVAQLAQMVAALELALAECQACKSTPSSLIIAYEELVKRIEAVHKRVEGVKQEYVSLDLIKTGVYEVTVFNDRKRDIENAIAAIESRLLNVPVPTMTLYGEVKEMRRDVDRHSAAIESYEWRLTRLERPSLWQRFCWRFRL